MSIKISTPRGTSDILPAQIPAWRNIESKALQILEKYNYKEIRTPMFEETELFARSMGQSSDVVQKQMLTLMAQNRSDASDVKDAGLSLRPENTAAVVRSYIENSLDRKEGLSKLFYIGPMFRGERPQKGRLRQFHQIGVEAIGALTAVPYLDAEVISLSVELLKGFGLTNFKLKINTLGSSEDKENFSKLLKSQLQSKVSQLCLDCQDRLNRNVFRILDCKNSSCREVVSKLDIGHSYLSKESRKYYSDVKDALKGLGVAFEETLNLVRGLDYYTHTVFEISDSSLGSQDALGAGGRYNNLVAQLGGPSVDAVGFALGIERILLAMTNKEDFKESAPMIYILALDEESLKKTFLVCHALRSQGISSEMNFKVASMKSLMRGADKVGCEYVGIMGENERQRGVITLKNMKSGEQEEISIKDQFLALINRLKK